MNNIDLQYQNLVKDILHNGVFKQTRNGGTISVFGRHIRHKMDEGFPLLTTKKLNFKNIWTELVWFLQGNTNIKWLLENDNPIWVGDAFKKYYETWKLDTYGVLESLSQKQFEEKILNNKSFAKEWGELGPIYGSQWRNWNGIDQIKNLIEEIQVNPDSRRLMVNAWNVGELNKMVLPPCHNLFQMYSVEKDDKRYLSIMVNIRSSDVPLGLPFNIASYALLLEIIARLTNMISDEIIINIGDAHIYLNQIDGVKEQLNREPFNLPKLVISNQVNFNEGIDEFLNSCSITDFQIENYISHPFIKIPLSN